MKLYKKENKENLSNPGFLLKVKTHFKQFGKYFIAFFNMIAALASIIGLVMNIATREKREFIIEYLKGVTDILYMYLNECILHHNKLRDSA